VGWTIQDKGAEALHFLLRTEVQIAITPQNFGHRFIIHSAVGGCRFLIDIHIEKKWMRFCFVFELVPREDRTVTVILNVQERTARLPMLVNAT
jgi:hypothetical protein